MALTTQQTANAQKYAQAGIQGAASGVSIISDIKQLGDAYKDVNTDKPEQQFDAYGKPVYEGGQLLSTVNDLNGAYNKTNNYKNRGKEILTQTTNGFIKGAQAGSAAGPWGALIGGWIGGSIGTFGTLFGQKKRRRTLERKAKLASANLFSAQQTFNNSMQAYNNQQYANQQYADLMNADNRINNIYQANTGE